MCRHPNGLWGMDILPLHLVQDGLRYGTQTDSCLSLGLRCLGCPSEDFAIFPLRGHQGHIVFIKTPFFIFYFLPIVVKRRGGFSLGSTLSRFPLDQLGMCMLLVHKKIFVKYMNISVDSYLAMC